jgi:hypothetical protein
MAPAKKTVARMKRTPATMTTHAAATYTLGGLAGSYARGGGVAATGVGRVAGSGVSLMS